MTNWIQDMNKCTGPVATFVQPKLPRVKFFPNKPGEPYMPCNGAEGEYFHAMWCEECERDKVMSGQATVEDADKDPDLYCEILNRSFRSDEPLPEWTYGEDGQPKCTQFIPAGQQIPQRCEHTADMFGCAHRWKVTHSGVTYHDCRCDLCGETKRESWD